MIATTSLPQAADWRPRGSYLRPLNVECKNPCSPHGHSPHHKIGGELLSFEALGPW